MTNLEGTQVNKRMVINCEFIKIKDSLCLKRNCIIGVRSWDTRTPNGKGCADGTAIDVSSGKTYFVDKPIDYVLELLGILEEEVEIRTHMPPPVIGR